MTLVFAPNKRELLGAEEQLGTQEIHALSPRAQLASRKTWAMTPFGAMPFPWIPKRGNQKGSKGRIALGKWLLLDWPTPIWHVRLHSSYLQRQHLATRISSRTDTTSQFQLLPNKPGVQGVVQEFIIQVEDR